MRARAALAVAFVAMAATTGTAGAVPSPPSPAPAPATKTVTYAGYRVEVPRSWPVHRLADEPGRCVRFDRHAVYLGAPGPEPDCPAHLVGRVEALWIRPAAAEVVDPADHEVQVVVEEAGLVVTGSYGADRGSVERILETATVTADAVPAEVPSPPAASTLAEAGISAAGAKWSGNGFDACTAPSVGAMQAWMTNSPFGAANIYIGGVSRACAQANLTASWVDAVHGQGWVLIPTYVGLQAPCTGFPNRINPSSAAAQGSAAADDAVGRASGLGLGAGTPIYFDMEGYNHTIASCSKAVMTFLDAWTVRLHQLGYVSGVYSSAASGIADLVRNSSRITDPDDIWYANWDRRATIWGDPYFPDSVYSNRQRIHQYWGDHNETWGGVTINIDSNVLDADVAGAGNGAPSRFTVDTFADAPGFDAPGGAQTGVLRAGTNYVFCRSWGPEVRAAGGVNHWWLRTDLDVGPANQWVSAVYLSRWGDDEARDNSGAQIVDCNEPYGAIGDKWRALGGVVSPVGPPKLPELASQLGGRFQEFWKGMVIWHPDTGAHPVYGAILAHYRSLESEARWGFPTMDEANAANGGRFQYMQRGLFLWSPSTGAHVIHGAILDAFAGNGREASLGYPTSDEIAHPDGIGVYQNYQNAVIHWTPQRGTWIVR